MYTIRTTISSLNLARTVFLRYISPKAGLQRPFPSSKTRNPLAVQNNLDHIVEDAFFSKGTVYNFENTNI